MSKKKAIEEILDFAKSRISKEEDRKPVKVMKMKQEWIKLHNEAIEIKKQANLLANKGEAICEEKWSKIKRELNYPPYDLHIDAEKMELQFFEDED